MKYQVKELTPEQNLGQASEFVSTKGLVDDMLLGIDSPAYYATQVLEASIFENKGNKQNVFDEIEADLLLKDGEEEPVELTEKEANEKYEDFNIRSSNLKIANFDLEQASIDLRVPKEVLVSAQQYGKFVVELTGVNKSPVRYYYENNHSKRIPLLFFPNPENNIGVIRQKDGNDLYFLDGFVTFCKDSLTIMKDKYTNELVLKSYLSVMINGSFTPEGFSKGLSGSLKQVFNFYIYKNKLSYSNAKNSYVSMIGGRNRESWNLRADVIDNLKAEICWTLETDKFESVVQKIDIISSNPRVAKSSMTQGEKFAIFPTAEKARLHESLFIKGKYDVISTIFPNMKVDKDLVKCSLVFCTVVNNLDNNQYGNSLWNKDFAGKIYSVYKGMPFRVKYSSQKTMSQIKVVTNSGEEIDNWVLCPIDEMSSENNFTIDEKPENILQLIHMGFEPEEVEITINGVTNKVIMFRDIPQYIDYLTSSDYNVNKNFELKPYSSMMSCVANHLGSKFGKQSVINFTERLRKLIDQKKLNQLLNLAGKEVVNVRLVNKK